MKHSLIQEIHLKSSQITQEEWVKFLSEIYRLVVARALSFTNILVTCTGFSLNHLISIGGSLGATSPHTTEYGLRDYSVIGKA